MEIIIIWLLFGLVSAVVASNKGRSGCGWFLLGVLLGPFGFILALAVTQDQKAIESKSLAKGENKKCPFCAEIIKKEAIVCKHCGRELPVKKIYECIIQKGGVKETKKLKLEKHETVDDIKVHYEKQGYKVLNVKKVLEILDED